MPARMFLPRSLCTPLYRCHWAPIVTGTDLHGQVVEICAFSASGERLLAALLMLVVVLAVGTLVGVSLRDPSFITVVAPPGVQGQTFAVQAPRPSQLKRVREKITQKEYSVWGMSGA